jgi:hypothetical protein
MEPAGSASLDDLGGLLETREHLEHRGESDRWCGEDFLAVVVEDKVGIEVARSDRLAPIPGVAMVGVLQVALGPMNGHVVAPHVGADLVTVESLRPLLVGLVFTSVGVVGDDEDPTMLCRRRAVGWEGERSVLEAEFHS